MQGKDHIARALSPRRETNPERLRSAVHGRTVLVTGASYGLGAATARKLSAAGAKVLLVARSEDQLASLEHEIVVAGGLAAGHRADLSASEDVAALVRWVLDEHGPPDVVVNNAGKSIRRSLTLQFDRPQDFERTMAVNYLGPVRMLLGLIPAMSHAGGGQLVNISTVGVRMHPSPRWGAYQASKGAFDTWLRSVVPELVEHQIDVTSIYMALIHTRMSMPSPSLRRVPGLTPEDAADVVARALVDRPRKLAPWWSWPTDVASSSSSGLITRAMQTTYRHSADSPSAQVISDATR